MKSKITCFICLIVFVITNVRCGADAIDPPLRPIVPTESIAGVFQSDDNILSLNNQGEYMMVGSMTSGRYVIGTYSINDSDFIQIRRPNNEYVFYRILREGFSRQVNGFTLLNGSSFHRILSEDQYNIPILDGLNTIYRGIGPNGQGYSLNLGLSRFRISEFVLPTNPREIIYGAYYFTNNLIHFNSTRDFIGFDSTYRTIHAVFEIIRNTEGQISSLRYNLSAREENQIPLVREGVPFYTTDELTALINNIEGSRFRIQFRKTRGSESARLFDFFFDRSLIISRPSFFIEGEGELLISLVDLRELIEYLKDNNIHFTMNNFSFRAVIRGGSHAEIISFSPILESNPNVLRIVKVLNDEFFNSSPL